MVISTKKKGDRLDKRFTGTRVRGSLRANRQWEARMTNVNATPEINDLSLLSLLAAHELEKLERNEPSDRKYLSALSLTLAIFGVQEAPVLQTFSEWKEFSHGPGGPLERQEIWRRPIFAVHSTRTVAQKWPKSSLESVSKLHQGLQSFRSMRRMEASFKKARPLQLRFSQSLARRRQRLSQAIVRSTIQRLGSCTNPDARSDRLMISVLR
jgi:hypothetical protein